MYLVLSYINHYTTSEVKRHATQSDAFWDNVPPVSLSWLQDKITSVLVLCSLMLLVECKCIIIKLVNNDDTSYQPVINPDASWTFVWGQVGRGDRHVSVVQIDS